MISPITEFMSTVMQQGGRSSSTVVAAGLGGAVTSVPEGHAIEVVMVAGVGIRDTYEAWGDALLQYHGKRRTAHDHDVFVSHLGYSTTVYYFYNQCDCGYHWPRQCGTTDPTNTPPSILKGCKNYEDTLIAAHESHKRAGLPINYMLVDSFWYGERHNGGMRLWEDVPELVGDTFPGNSTHPGMKRLSAAVGGLPFKAHAGGWSSKNGGNPYFANPEYRFVTHGTTGVPQGPGLWDHVFSVNRDNWNLRAIKQDHINEQLSMPQCTTTVNVARDWLAGMGEAAARQNFSIQYCMTLPSVTMNSVTVPPSTHQRLGGDYLAGDNVNNWNIGSAAIFIHAVGLLPFKDAFLSNTTQPPPTHSNTGGGEQRGGFKGFKEVAPALHAASALLSAGPVSPSDGVDGHDYGLIMSLCRADGMLLKPDKPARTLDVQWHNGVFKQRASAATLPPTATPPPPSGPSGRATWSTFTTLALSGGGNGGSNGGGKGGSAAPAPAPASAASVTWGYVLVEGSDTAWHASAATLGFPNGGAGTAGVAWTRPNAQPSMSAADIVATIGGIPEGAGAAGTAKMPAPFGPGSRNPLHIPATGTNYGDFAVIYTAPTLPNGFVLLGEVGKMVPVSRVRFVQVAAAPGTKVVTVLLKGTPSEIVEVSYILPPAISNATVRQAVELSSGSSITTKMCAITTDGTASCKLS